MRDILLKTKEGAEKLSDKPVSTRLHKSDSYPNLSENSICKFPYTFPVECHLLSAELAYASSWMPRASLNVILQVEWGGLVLSMRQSWHCHYSSRTYWVAHKYKVLRLEKKRVYTQQSFTSYAYLCTDTGVKYKLSIHKYTCIHYQQKCPESKKLLRYGQLSGAVTQ